MNVHFICRGNILRSLMAEAYLRSLKIKNIDAISSGTIAHSNWAKPQAHEHFATTLATLDKHNIKSFAKQKPEQLTQKRLDDNHDIVVLMNQRVIDEANEIVQLPKNILDWEIADVGEGHRPDFNNREAYAEDIYQEIVLKVDSLLKTIY